MVSRYTPRARNGEFGGSGNDDDKPGFDAAAATTLVPLECSIRARRSFMKQAHESSRLLSSSCGTSRLNSQSAYSCERCTERADGFLPLIVRGTLHSLDATALEASGACIARNAKECGRLGENPAT